MTAAVVHYEQLPKDSKFERSNPGTGGIWSKLQKEEKSSRGSTISQAIA